MARPKRTEANAYERIVNAFWTMLAEMPYSKITISGLSHRAGVNHNLIYYYFENIDGLAEKLFMENMESGEPQQLLRQILLGELETDEIIRQPEKTLVISRIRLFMRSNSSYLNQIAKNAIMAEWLKSVGKSKEQLTVEERIDLQFIFGGLTSVIGDPSNDLTAISCLPKRLLGSSIKETLRRLGQKQETHEGI